MARAIETPLRVIRVFTRDWPVPPSLLAVPAHLHVTPAAEDAGRDELERAVATLPEEVKAEAAFLHGEPAMESQVADLICGKLRTAPAVRPGTEAPDAGVRLRV